MSAVVGAARGAARGWGLPEPELIRVSANAVFDCGSVLLRVGRATAPMRVALTLADRLTAAGLRVARPARHDWIEVDGLSVTAWDRIDVHQDADVDWERVGSMVATLHSIDPAGVDHPLPYCGDFPWWRLGSVVPEMDDPMVDAGARAGMRAALEKHGWWVGHCRTQQPTLLHGDVHPGNVLVDPGGPVLIDWDLLCVGPREWDHSALITWTERWGGEPGMYEAFAHGYADGGGRAPDPRVAAAIAEMRLLIATLMRVRAARASPEHRPEAVRRLAYWRGDDDAPTWRAR